MNSIKQQQVKNYIIYAFGEVFLIVIGILIALAINNWNQNRQTQALERLYLESLKSEFELSKQKLVNLISVNKQTYTAALKLEQMIRSGPDRIDEIELSQSLYNAFAYEIDYRPNSSAIEEMINSGELKTISNPQLRFQLMSWESTLAGTHRQEAIYREERNKLMDMFILEGGSIRQIFSDLNLVEEIAESGNKKSIQSNNKILDSKVIENRLLIYILTARNMDEVHYSYLLEFINDLLLLLESELNN